MGVARGDVDAGDGLRGRGDLRRGGHGQRSQFLGMRGFRGERMRAGLDHAARFLVQLGRVETDDAGERLAMGEAAIRRHQPLGMPGRDLDMIAEHRIVADLERADRRRVAIAGFEPGDRPAAVGRRVAQARRARRHSLRRCSPPSTRPAAARRPARAASLSTSASCPPRRGSKLSSNAGRSGSPAIRPAAPPRRPARRAAVRGRAGCRGPPPAAQRAREVGHRLQRGAHALAANRILVQPGDQRQPLLDRRRSVSGAAMSSDSSRRPAAVWQRSISPSKLPATPPPAERVSSRLSRLAASIAMWLAAGDAPRRVEQDARAFLRRVEIGEQPACCGELGARRRRRDRRASPARSGS